MQSAIHEVNTRGVSFVRSDKQVVVIVVVNIVVVAAAAAAAAARGAAAAFHTLTSSPIRLAFNSASGRAEQSASRSPLLIPVGGTSL
jgi:hypothetical protein